MDGGNQPATEGLMPRAFRHITDKIGLNKNKNLKFLIQASYLEIYNNEVYDLLGKNPKKALKLRQVKTYWDLSRPSIDSKYLCLSTEIKIWSLRRRSHKNNMHFCARSYASQS